MKETKKRVSKDQLLKDLESQRNLLETIINTVPVPIFYKDKDLRYIDVNDEFVKFVGLEKDEIRGKTVFDLYPEHLSKKYHEADLELLKKGGNQIYCYRIRNANGEYREVEFYKSTFTDKNGNLMGIVGAILDIDERKKLLNKLEEEKKRAEHASIAKSRFLSNISHEIRTPLTTIVGFINLLMNTKLTEEQRRYIKHIQSASDTLLAIISEVLDLSKIESGEMVAQIERVNLFDLIDNVSDIMKYNAFKKGLDFFITPSVNLPEYIYTDSKMLKQILLNLLSNAIKFTERGFVEVTSEYLYLNGKHTLSFSVKDTGIGIKKEMLIDIFKPFVQVDNTYSRKYGGVGLGLNITKKLVSMLGGDISVDSKEGEGTTFIFNFAIESVERGIDGEYINHGFCNAVILSDENSFSEKLQRTLNCMNIDSTVTSDLIYLMNLILMENVDLLLIDADSMILYFEEIKNKMKQLDIKMPTIVVYSRVEDMEYFKNMMDFGVVLFTEKPITIWGLRRLLSDIHKKGDDTIKFYQIKPIDIKTRYKVLIVEDVDMNRILFRTLISEMLPNAEIVEAENGEQGFVKYKMISPDIVFMDIQMPIMNGYESAKAIRDFESKNQLKTVPIIAVTANYEKEERQRCLAAGITDYLSKPIMIDQLGEILAKYLNNKLNVNNENQQSKDISNVIDFGFFTKNKVPKSLVEQLFRQGLEEFPIYLEKLAEFVKLKDFGNIRAKAHKIKGAALSLGFINMAEKAEAINKRAKEGLDCLDLLKEMYNEWDKVRSEVEKFLFDSQS
ncbi:MAG: ATP-binding protein [Calditerrivibrio sp.]|nr:ATP-binding protein [Calditerrivibrio sp.]